MYYIFIRPKLIYKIILENLNSFQLFKSFIQKFYEVFSKLSRFQIHSKSNNMLEVVYDKCGDVVVVARQHIALPSSHYIYI